MIGLSTLQNSLLALVLLTLAFQVTGGSRDEACQAKLYTAGKSKCDGRTNKSYHQSGKALDVFCLTPEGKASWDILHLTTVATAMLQASAQLGHELKWGGLWKSWQDYPHFELRD